MSATPGGLRLEAVDLVAVLPGEAGPHRVLDGVSLELAAGELVDVVGPSGAGKSTLLRALARLLPGATGELRLDGRSAADVPAEAWRAKVALVPQTPSIAEGTIRDNLLLPWGFKVRAGAQAPTDAQLRKALDSVGLTAIDLDRSGARLSVGQAARVALLRVLLTEPEVLLLDEPDANLDNESAEQVARATDAFARTGGAVVRVRHQRTDALASRRFRLEAGRLSEVVL